MKLKVKIEAIYQAKKGPKTTFETEFLSINEGLLLAEDMEKTGRIHQLTFIDTNEANWAKKELKKLVEEIEAEPHDIVVYFDGGFDKTTNTSGLGVVIYYKQNDEPYRIRKNAMVKQLRTNNEAEYAALHLSMKELEQLSVSRLPVTFIGDSQVVINQLNDEWPCFEPELNRWMDRIEEIVKRMRIMPTYKIIPRTKNKEADRLADQALQGIDIASNLQLDERDV